MSRYPRERIDARLSAFEIFDAHRVFGALRMPLQVYASPSRFCDGKSGFAMLYAALSFETCILETVVRDRFVHRQRRELPLAAVLARGYARISTLGERPLNLLDLRDSGCADIGAPTDAVRARHLAAGQALGRAIHAEHGDVDGFIYASRLTADDCIAVFERALEKLIVLEACELKDHAELPDVLERHAIQLVGESGGSDMTAYGIVSFGAVYFSAVATPGPGVAAVIARSLARGHSGAAAFIAGFVVGDLLWFSAAALGLSALTHAFPGVFVVVKSAGVAYLLFLAGKLWLSPARAPEEVEALEQTRWHAFVGSLTLTLGNPKPMLFFLALLPTLLPLEGLDAAGIAEIALTIAVILPVVLGGYVFAAAKARRWFRSPRATQLLNRGSGTLMAAAAVAVATR